MACDEEELDVDKEEKLRQTVNAKEIDTWNGVQRERYRQSLNLSCQLMA